MRKGWIGVLALAGGLYGMAVGGLFAGESMFHRASGASKIALTYLVEYLKIRGFVLFDTQVVTEVTALHGSGVAGRVSPE
jgi:leucyl/phenylalanyl-tRNA--protein transferase